MADSPPCAGCGIPASREAYLPPTMRRNVVRVASVCEACYGTLDAMGVLDRRVGDQTRYIAGDERRSGVMPWVAGHASVA